MFLRMFLCLFRDGCVLFNKSVKIKFLAPEHLNAFNRQLYCHVCVWRSAPFCAAPRCWSSAMQACPMFEKRCPEDNGRMKDSTYSLESIAWRTVRSNHKVLQAPAGVNRFHGCRTNMGQRSDPAQVLMIFSLTQQIN